MIQKIGIIGGLGQMGAVFRNALESLYLDVIVTDKDRSIHDEKELVKESELIIISVPIAETVNVIRRIHPWLDHTKILCDFTSVKTHSIPEALKTEASVISAHPMFGPLSDFSGQNMILLPARENKHLHKMERLFENLNLKVFVMKNWEKHDQYMSMIQGLMHFSHIVLAKTLHKKDADLETLMAICSPVYQATFAFSSRIMMQSSRLYTHILMDNPENMNILQSFVQNASESLKLIDRKDDQEFQKQFEESAEFLGEIGKELSEQSDFLIKKMQEYATKEKI